MAVTKIWKVKDRLDITINYAVNGEKTATDRTSPGGFADT